MHTLNINLNISFFLSKNKFKKWRSSRSNGCPCNIVITIVKAVSQSIGDASHWTEGSFTLFQANARNQEASSFLSPLIISASLKFERSPYFNHQFCTIQQPLFGFRFLDSTKKAPPLKCPMKRFMCLLQFASAFFDLHFGQFWDSQSWTGEVSSLLR